MESLLILSIYVLFQLQRGMKDSVIVAELPASQEDALQQVSETSSHLMSMIVNSDVATRYRQ